MEMKGIKDFEAEQRTYHEDIKDLPKWGKIGAMGQARAGMKVAYEAVMDVMRDVGALAKAGTYKLGRKSPAWYEYIVSYLTRLAVERP